MPARIEHKIVNGIELKWCSACKDWRELEQFNTTGTKNRTWDGLFYVCAACENKKRRNNRRRQALSAWNAIVRRVERDKRYIAKGIKIKMQKEQFIAWYIANWFPGCLVDRKDNLGDYRIDNIQLVTLLEHNYKLRKDNLAFLGITERDGERYCYSCKQTKEYADFGQRKDKKSPFNPLGLKEECKQCAAAKRRAYYAKRGKQ